MKTIFITFALVVFFSSCKQRISVGGVILDKETRQPVINVYISQKKLKSNTFVDDIDSSDNEGHYKYNHILDGELKDGVFATLYFYKSELTLVRNIRNGVMDDTVLLPSLTYQQLKRY